MKVLPEYEFRFQLSAGAAVQTAGTIPEVTVAKADVRATGKIALFDDQGRLTRDPDKADKKLPVYTDQRTLDTLMSAIKAAGGRLKVREDHDDTIGARVGYMMNFKRLNDRVVANLTIFDAYRNRAIVMETVEKTPDQIGMSIDLDPVFEIVGDKALMRVASISAVDLVDAGAITPGGFFLNADVENSDDSEPNRFTMAKDDKETNPPGPGGVPKEFSDAFKNLSDSHTALTNQVGECMKMIKGLAEKLNPAPAADAMKAAKDAETATALTTMAATITEKVTAGVTEKFNAVASELKGELATMKKEQAALGLKSGKGAGGGGTDPDPSDRGDKGKDDSKKSYLELVADKKKEGKLSASDCHREVMASHPDKYREHMDGRGITKVARVA